MQNSPLVSYIIPSYNHAAYIDKAIQSVLDQTYNPIELIVVDDGSVDDTRAVLEKYRGRPNITILFNEVNLRQGATINKALKIARGEFVGFLPSDDWLLPDKVRLQVEKFKHVSERVGVIYGRGSRFFGNDDGVGELKETDYCMYNGIITAQLLTKGNFIYPITPLFRRKCFEMYPFDESYTAEGEAIYLKLSLSFEFDFVDQVLGVMRDHPTNTGKMTNLMYEENLRYLVSFFERDDLPRAIRDLKNQRIAMLKKIKAMEMMISNRNYKLGRKLAFEACVLQPRYLCNIKLLLATLLSCLPQKIADSLLDKFYSKKQGY